MVKWSLGKHFKTVQCPGCNFFLILLFLPWISFSSLSLLFCSFAFCTIVSFPFFFLSPISSPVISLFLTSWLFKLFSYFTFLGFCSAQIFPVVPFSRNLHCFASCLHLLFVINYLGLLHLSSFCLFLPLPPSFLPEFFCQPFFSIFLPLSPLMSLPNIPSNYYLLSSPVPVHFSSTFSLLTLTVSFSLSLPFGPCSPMLPLCWVFPFFSIFALLWSVFLSSALTVFTVFHLVYLFLFSCQLTHYRLLFYPELMWGSHRG